MSTNDDGVESLDFEKLMEDHANILKLIIKSDNDDNKLVSRLKRNTTSFSLQVSILFNLRLMGNRFCSIWESYVKDILEYISISKSDGLHPDFGDDKEYLELKKVIRKLRSDSGKIIGFFSYYLDKRLEIKEKWTKYIQTLKNFTDTLRMQSDLTKSARDFGKLLNQFR